MKRLLAILLALSLALTMVACGKDKEDDDDSDKSSKKKTESTKDKDDEDSEGGPGYYKAVYMEDGGEDATELMTSFEDMNMGVFLVLEDDGTGVLDIYGEKTDIKWEKKKMYITDEDGEEYESPFKWKNGQYVMEYNDSTIKFAPMDKALKKAYKNGEWNNADEFYNQLDGDDGNDETSNKDDKYTFVDIETLKKDLEDYEAADANYSDKYYCTEGVITDICTDEQMESVTFAIAKKDNDNFNISTYIYDMDVLKQAQEIGVGNEAKFWFYVYGVSEPDWGGYSLSMDAITVPGSSSPGVGSGTEENGNGDGDEGNTYGTSFILPDLSGGPHEDSGYYLIYTYEENGSTYSQKDLENAGVDFDMMLCTDGTGYAHLIGEYYDLTWTDGTIVVAVDDSETEEMVYTLSRAKGQNYITIADTTNGISMTFERSGDADY